VLRALFVYREREAERLDHPPFKIIAEGILMELVRRTPSRVDDLHAVPGMTPEQVRRHGQALLQAIQEGLRAPAEHPPREAREPQEVRDRYDRLRTWRKERARARGVESDVIVPRTTLQDLARRAPRTHDALATIQDFGPWRQNTYGDEILAILTGSTSPQDPA
jgi:ribonuclease D